ncbi:MAG: hypothetical protein ACRDZW_02495 [Acidimicrobiales bacterium]
MSAATGPAEAVGTPDEALGAARAFVDAVAWGEHHRVWELLGAEGRKTVLRVAVNHGMDEALAARLREGTAAAGESDEFLSDLVAGLRADLSGNDLDSVEYAPDPVPEPGRCRIGMSVPMPGLLGIGGVGSLPVGTVELAEVDGAWRVERLVVARTGPA